MTEPDEFWIPDARAALCRHVLASEVFAEEIKGPMCDVIRSHMQTLSGALGCIELVYLRTKQGDVTI